MVDEKNPDLDADTRAAVARAVGIGAVKYADLSSERVKDYTFDLDRMLAFDGNTGPYLQYAHARIKSMFRRAEIDARHSVAGAPVVIAEPQERALALALLGFADAVDAVGRRVRAAQAVHLPVRTRAGVHVVLRGVPRAEGRRRHPRRHASCCARRPRPPSRPGLGLLGIDAPEQL